MFRTTNGFCLGRTGTEVLTQTHQINPILSSGSGSRRPVRPRFIDGESGLGQNSLTCSAAGGRSPGAVWAWRSRLLWISWCFLSALSTVKRVLQTSHWNGRSPVCDLMWSLSRDGRLKARPQTSQASRVAAWCRRSCSLRRWTKPRPHSEQVKGFSGAWMRRCLLRQPRWYGFSPVWTRWCTKTFTFLVKRLPQTEQLWGL
uniref:Uncharacterized protein n=1 Tax=Fundulus heteroclitus TaxID=8078 RepID=A0A3Q2NWU7_FUNHE